MSTHPADECHPIVTRARSRLRDTGHRALNGIDVSFSDGAVVLSGKVHSYHEKQIAQATIMTIEEVERLINDIEVHRLAD